MQVTVAAITSVTKQTPRGFSVAHEKLLMPYILWPFFLEAQSYTEEQKSITNTTYTYKRNSGTQTTWYRPYPVFLSTNSLSPYNITY